MTDFDAVKKRATLPTRTLPLCLAGELVDEIGRLEAQLADAKPPTNLGDVSPKRAIAEQIADLQEQMRESTVDFRLRALPTRKWSLFEASQPARKEGEPDETWEPRIFGWQAEMVSKVCIDPQMSSEQVGELADVLHQRSWVELATAAYVLNKGLVDIPNSDAASELIRDSEQT